MSEPIIKDESFTIGECDYCKAPVPDVFLVKIDSITVCYPCYSEKIKQLALVDYFFEGKTHGEVERLRKAVPKFPERINTKTTAKEWPDEFTKFCTRKASWYGFKDAFEFFGQILK